MVHISKYMVNILKLHIIIKTIYFDICYTQITKRALKCNLIFTYPHLKLPLDPIYTNLIYTSHP